MRKFQYVLLIILAIVAVMRVVYEFQQSSAERKQVAKFEQRQKEIRKKGALKVVMLNNTTELDSKFNSHLQTCEAVNYALSDGTNFVIYGNEGTFCNFEKYNPPVCLECKLPMNIAERYALASGGIDSFINEVNNDKKYCNIVGTDAIKNVDKNKIKKEKNKKHKNTK